LLRWLRCTTLGGADHPALLRGVSGMSTRASTWLAWSVCAISLVLTALGLLFLALNRSHPDVPVFEFALQSTVIVASCSSVGVFLASRRPAHPVGWLFGAVGLLSGVHLFCGEYAIYREGAGGSSYLAARTTHRAGDDRPDTTRRSPGSGRRYRSSGRGVSAHRPSRRNGIRRTRAAGCDIAGCPRGGLRRSGCRRGARYAAGAAAHRRLRGR
jgi:hypothetical protein